MMKWFATGGIAARLGAVAAIVLLGQSLLAQTEPASCAAAAQSVSTSSPRSVDVERLAQCPMSGPSALSAVWQRTTQIAEPELNALVESSTRTRDGRVYGAVAAVAADNGRPTPVRLASLAVLSAYYRPDLAPTMSWLRSARIGDPIPSAPDAYAGTGIVPVPDARLVDFPALLFRLAREGGDSTVARAALRLRQYLALTDPNHTPVAAGAVRLVAGCRNLVTLQSTLDVTIPLRVRVAGTTTEHIYTLKRWVSGPPIQLALDLPPGTVVASYGSGRELARLIDRKGTCTK
jgi:hypothetical protein